MSWTAAVIVIIVLLVVNDDTQNTVRQTCTPRSHGPEHAAPRQP